MIKKIIIIADKKYSYVKSMQQFLEDYGYDILIAYGGLSGFNMARDKKPDLILLDSMLSGVNGFQICSLLKFDKKYENVRIIIMSDSNDTKSKNLTRISEADGYIEKPIDYDNLIRKIKQLEY